MAKKRKREYYCVPIDGEFIPVTREVYEAYYECENRERYLRKRDKQRGLLYFSDLGDGDCDFVECLADKTVDVEQVVITKALIDELRSRLADLNPAEIKLLTEIYYQDRSIRQIARELKVPEVNIRRRRDALLEKLKKYF